MGKTEMLKGLLVAMAIVTASPTLAQKLDEQERLNQFDKAIGALNELEALTNKMTNAKKVQCITAIASQNVCSCLSSNLPVAIDFVQYVAVVTRTKEELAYDKQSTEDKKLIDNVRAARDKCVCTKSEPRR